MNEGTATLTAGEGDPGDTKLRKDGKPDGRSNNKGQPGRKRYTLAFMLMVIDKIHELEAEGEPHAALAVAKQFGLNRTQPCKWRKREPELRQMLTSGGKNCDVHAAGELRALPRLPEGTSKVSVASYGTSFSALKQSDLDRAQHSTASSGKRPAAAAAEATGCAKATRSIPTADDAATAPAALAPSPGRMTRARGQATAEGLEAGAGADARTHHDL